MRIYLDRTARILLAYPLVPVLLLLGIAGWTGQYLTDFGLRAGSDQLHLESDPNLRDYDRTRERFGTDDYVIASYRFEEGTIFEPGRIREAAQLTRDLAALDHVDRVVSPTNVDLFQNQPPQLSPLGPLPNPVRLTHENVNLEKAREELLGHPVWEDNIISESGRTISFISYFRNPTLNDDSEAETPSGNGQDSSGISGNQPDLVEEEEYAEDRTETVRDIRRVIDRFEQETGRTVYLAGVPIINVDMVRFIQQDMILFGVGVSVFVILMLSLLFQRWQYVVLSVLTCGLTVLISLGILTAAGRRITVVTSNLSSLIFILTLVHPVHFLVYYQERTGETPGFEGESSHIRIAWRVIIIPCFYTAATTAIGFASLGLSDIKPVQDFGLFMAIGVSIGFVVSFFFLPPLLRLLPVPEPGGGLQMASNWLKWLGRFARKRKYILYVTAVLIGTAGIMGLSDLNADARFIDYFRGDTEISRGLQFIDSRMGGTSTLEVVVKGEDGFFLEEEAIEKLERLHSFFDDIPEAGATLSLASISRETRAITRHIGREDMSLENRLQLAGEFMDADLLSSYVTEDWSQARVVVRLQESSRSLERNKILAQLSTFLSEQEEFQGVETTLTGVFVLYTNLLNSLIGNQIRSGVLVLIFIGIMLFLLFRSLRITILGLIPNLLPILLVLGIMGYAGIHLDMVTVMIGSVALGVAVDGTIHYTFRYREERRLHGYSHLEAMDVAHATVGRAILYTCITVIAGFWILCLSRFTPTIHFGFLTGVAMVGALLATLTLLPLLYSDFLRD